MILELNICIISFSICNYDCRIVSVLKSFTFDSVVILKNLITLNLMRIRKSKCGKHALFTAQMCAKLAIHLYCDAHSQKIENSWCTANALLVNVHHKLDGVIVQHIFVG